jgi:putative transposase
LRPPKGRTWGRRGQTPVVTVTGGSNKRVSLAALIAIKPGQHPRLIYRVHKSRRRGKNQRKGFTETGYAQLLDAAHQQLTGPLVVVWDNLNSHVSAAMAELIAARDWLTVYQLPPYAHELNPVEPVWSHLKRSLANLAKRNLSELTALVKTRLRRMQYRPALLEGFLASTRLDLTPFGNPRGQRSFSPGKQAREDRNDNGAAYPAPPRGQRTVRSASLGITLRGISR